MARLISIAVVLAVCLAPARAAENPYAAYAAKFVGEYFLGKCLDEAWDSATGAPDIRELDARLRAFEGALAQVDARLSGRIGELRRELDKRPTREEVRAIVLKVLAELEARIVELERRADRIELKIAQFEEVFGIVTTVPPAPLIRSSVEEGNPAVHPLTAEWARLLCECETNRLKIEDLRSTRQEDHPEVVAALKADEAILQRIAACHAKVIEQSVLRIDERMDLLRVERLKPTHPKVRLVDDNLASLLWLRAVSKPIADGPTKGRLAVPKDMIGPKCSEILAAFRLAQADVTVLAPLFRHLLSVKLEQPSGPPGAVPDDLSEHVQKTAAFLDRTSRLCAEVRETDAELETARKDYSELHDSVRTLRTRQKTLVAQVRRAHEVSEAALTAALAGYVEKLQYERPTNPRMLAFRAEVLLPLNELADLTLCSDWDNRVAVQETWERVLKWKGGRAVGVVRGAKIITNSIGMKLVLISAGQFMMGSPDAGAPPFDELRQHHVRITKPFYLSAHEITVGQFRLFANETRHADTEWQNAFAGQTDEHPVVKVSWEDANAFLKWLSGKEGKSYRLPTEAEWEYACRAGTKTKWSFGNEEATLAEHAWYKENSGYTTHPVGQKKPNAWGLYDIHGNVWEWCQDWYEIGYYAQSSEDDPKGPSSAAHRVLRGGSWDYSAAFSRSAARAGGLPVLRFHLGGFRAARTP